MLVVVVAVVAMAVLLLSRRRLRRPAWHGAIPNAPMSMVVQGRCNPMIVQGVVVGVVNSSGDCGGGGSSSIGR